MKILTSISIEAPEYDDIEGRFIIVPFFSHGSGIWKMPVTCQRYSIIVQRRAIPVCHRHQVARIQQHSPTFAPEGWIGHPIMHHHHHHHDDRPIMQKSNKTSNTEVIVFLDHTRSNLLNAFNVLLRVNHNGSNNNKNLPNWWLQPYVFIINELSAAKQKKVWPWRACQAISHPMILFRDFGCTFVSKQDNTIDHWFCDVVVFRQQRTVVGSSWWNGMDDDFLLNKRVEGSDYFVPHRHLTIFFWDNLLAVRSTNETPPSKAETSPFCGCGKDVLYIASIEVFPQIPLKLPRRRKITKPNHPSASAVRGSHLAAHCKATNQQSTGTHKRTVEGLCWWDKAFCPDILTQIVVVSPILWNLKVMRRYQLQRKNSFRNRIFLDWISKYVQFWVQRQGDAAIN